MAIGGKQRDQADTDDTAGPSDEDPHSTTAYPQLAAATPRDTGAAISWLVGWFAAASAYLLLVPFTPAPPAMT